MLTFRRNSLYTRFLIVLFIIIIPLLVTQWSMYKTSSALVQSELYGMAASNVEYLRTNFENVIMTSRKQMHYLLTHPQIKNFNSFAKHSTPYVYYSDIYTIQSLLKFCNHSNEYSKEIILYYPQQGLGISCDDYIRQYSQEEMRTLFQDYTAYTTKPWELDGEIVIGNSFQFPFLKATPLPVLYIETILNRERIQKDLTSYSAFSAQAAYLISHETGLTISSDPNDAFPLNTEQIIRRAQDDSVYHFQIQSSQAKFIAVVCYSRILDISFVQLIPAERLNYIAQRFRRYIFLFFCLAILGIFKYAWSMNLLIRRPTKDLVHAFQRAGHGEFDHTLSPIYLDEYNTLATNFNSMLQQINHLIQTNYENVIRLQRAEFKQLQSQINPHFLYNSFFMLRHMVQEEDTPNAMDLLNHLAEYFRYIARNDSDEITLEAEYNHAKNYTSIQQRRFDRALQCTFDELPEPIRALPVPRLILQPIIENAIEHCPPSFQRKLTILVCFDVTDEKVQIVLENNGALLQSTLEELIEAQNTNGYSAAETTGLMNIDKRLRYFYQSSSGISLSRGRTEGLRVCITIPRSSTFSKCRKE